MSLKKIISSFVAVIPRAPSEYKDDIRDYTTEVNCRRLNAAFVGVLAMLPSLLLMDYKLRADGLCIGKELYWFSGAEHRGIIIAQALTIRFIPSGETGLWGGTCSWILMICFLYK